MNRFLALARRRDTGDTRGVECDADGNLYTSPVAGADATVVRIVDVNGDSCMDEVNDALQVNVVAGGAGGGAATIADGADVTQGALGDAEVAVAGPASSIAILKRIRTLLAVVAVTVADGADVTQGSPTDAAVITDVAGTVSGKLRGLVKWAFERMPASLGQKTKLLSLPVTLASDEDALAVTGTFYPVTQPVSLAVAPSTPVTGPIDIEVGGVAPQLDDTDKIAMSVYGTDAAVGDTPLPVDATYGVRISHPNATSATTDADADTNNAPLTDVGNVLRYWARLWAFNGTTWDRLRKDATGALRVSLYGKNIAAGDKELNVSASGNLEVDVASALPAGTNSVGGTKDDGPQWVSVWGIVGERFTSADASGAAAAVSDAPTGGQKLVITDILVSVDTAMRVDFTEETSGDFLASLYLPENGSAQVTPRSTWKMAVADKQLMVQTSVAGNIAITAFYHSEA